jgi:uncharacterized membrane protein YcaP (DUF421 family)
MSEGIHYLAWIGIKTILLYATAIVGLRLAKQRLLAELSPFDFVAAVAIGAIVGRIPSASDADYLAGAATLLTVLAAHALICYLRRHPTIALVVEQPPRLLVANGKIREDETRRCGLSRADIDTLLRQRGVHHLSDVQYLIFEQRGAVSLVIGGNITQEHGPDLFRKVVTYRTRSEMGKRQA